MDIVSTGLVTLLNGAWVLVTTVVEPAVLAVLVLVASALWLSLIEIEEYDRQGSKPFIGRH